jgi:nucleoside-diphosphate-sugar epimerase
MNWQGKRVLVTGSSGVIGRCLVDRLLSMEANILSIDVEPFPFLKTTHRNITHIQNNVGNVIHPIVEFNPEIVFHLAAMFGRTKDSKNYWMNSISNNAVVSHVLLKLLANSTDTKVFVFASSYLVYDPDLYLSTYECSLFEGDNLRPRNVVGLSKYFTEKELEFISMENKNFRSVSARIFRVYGYGSHDIISRWIRSVLKGEDLQVYGRYAQFDYIFADDVAVGLIKMAETKQANGPINLGSGVSTSIDTKQRNQVC